MCVIVLRWPQYVSFLVKVLLQFLWLIQRLLEGATHWRKQVMCFRERVRIVDIRGLRLRSVKLFPFRFLYSFLGNIQEIFNQTKMLLGVHIIDKVLLSTFREPIFPNLLLVKLILRILTRYHLYSVTRFVEQRLTSFLLHLKKLRIIIAVLTDLTQ